MNQTDGSMAEWAGGGTVVGIRVVILLVVVLNKPSKKPQHKYECKFQTD